jgi:hypothetical protein
MPQKRTLVIAAVAICLPVFIGAILKPSPQHPENRNPAYADSIVKDLPLRVDIDREKQFTSEREEWGESTVSVTNPRDAAMVTNIELNFTPFIHLVLWDVDRRNRANRHNTRGDCNCATRDRVVHGARETGEECRTRFLSRYSRVNHDPGVE